MRTEQLKYLVDVAETHSMSKTAERLFVSPQAVSKAIKQLEQELDVELVVRTNMGVNLTRIGASVVERAKAMLDEELVMRQAVAKSKHRIEKDNTFSMRICSTSAVINIALPDIIAKFAYVNINIIPRIYMVDSVQELLAHVAQGKCDIGLLTYNEEALFRKFAEWQEVLDMKLLARDEMVAVLDQHLYHMGQSSLSIEEMNKYFCCMFSLLPIDEFATDASEVQVMSSNDADFHRAMLKKTDANVLMPRLAYRQFFSGKNYVALPLEGYPVSLLHTAVYRQDAHEGLKRFASLIQLEL